jgi:glucosamine--fructose-6-phosphate aminotransferase (isomerizing)
MCGIVGYLGGNKDPKAVIIDGLRKLEYRGYDSAGVAIWDGSDFKRLRASGKLKELEALAAGVQFSGKVGIGHTRWATHGAPSERNAHPHRAGDVTIVHNGIIENYLEIREALKEQGIRPSSDTDTELVAHLINLQLQKTPNLLKAVREVRTQLQGAYALLVVWDQSPHEMVALKDGPPLVVGIGENESFVASDIQALLQHTKKFVFLGDREIAHLHDAQVDYFDAQGERFSPQIQELNWSADLVEKQGFPHFMLKEIYEQPRAIAAAMEQHVSLEPLAVNLTGVGFHDVPVSELENLDPLKDWLITQDVFKSLERVFIVACGTSYYAAQVAKYYIEQLARLPVETDIASEFRYRHPVVPPNSLFLVISQSGETADTLAAIRLAKQLGATTMSLCNVRNSSIDREAHGHIYMNSGPEIGVASTKAFVSSLTVLNLMALAMAKARGLLPKTSEQLHLRAMLNLPSQMEGVLAYDKYFAEAAGRLKQFKGFLFMGRGVNFPIAMEGALKLKELAYRHAEGYAAGEMKHGPLALIDEQMAVIMVAPHDEVYEKSISNLEEARARGGKVWLLSNGEQEKFSDSNEAFVNLPKAHWATNPILAVVPLQLMAYHLACALGHDVDQPRNLAKSVTVE